MTQALSLRQQELLTHMAASGGRIIRHPGGYWTTSDTPVTSAGSDGRSGVPVWYAGTQTIYACESRGLIEREHAVERGRPLPSWQDPRHLTEVGRALLSDLK